MAGQRRPSLSQRSELTFDIHSFSTNVDTREIFLHGYMEDVNIEDCEEPGVDYRMSTQFIKNLRLLDYLDDKPILIHMNTCGGHWNFGMAIYDAIKCSRSHITILAYSHSRSMSSIIPQAADLRIIMPHADFLIHWGTNAFSGNHTSVIAEADWAKQICEDMLDVYVEKCKSGDFWKRNNLRTEKEIREYLRLNMDKKQEWYMTARESVDMGFMDAVMGDEGFETIDDIKTGGL